MHVITRYFELMGKTTLPRPGTGRDISVFFRRKAGPMPARNTRRRRTRREQKREAIHDSNAAE